MLEFPPVSSVVVDELTRRLVPAARDGERTPLLHAVRTHLVGADGVAQDTFVRAWEAG